MITVIIIIMYVIAGVGGQLLFKYGTNKKFEFAIAAGNISVSFNWMIIVGILSYVVSFLLFLVLLSKFNISRITPILVGLNYCMMLVGAAFFLHEKITVVNMIGIATIFAGIMIMVFSSH